MAKSSGNRRTRAPAIPRLRSSATGDGAACWATTGVAVHLHDAKEAWRIRWFMEFGVNASDPIVMACVHLHGLRRGRARSSNPALGTRAALKTMNLHAKRIGRAVQGPLRNQMRRHKAPRPNADFETGEEKWAQARNSPGARRRSPMKPVRSAQRRATVDRARRPSGFQPTPGGVQANAGRRGWPWPHLPPQQPRHVVGDGENHKLLNDNLHESIS
jgi:hypothetical protein